MFFARFPAVNGWGTVDIVTLWAVSAGGFGLGLAFYGNALRLAKMIAQGELDAWMLYPRALLSHLLIGRMNPSALGDAVFGYAVYFIIAKPDLPHFCLFAMLTLSVAVLFAAFSVLTGCLGFYMGNAESLSEQWLFALVTFSTYPAGLFTGSERLLLFTVIPSAFISDLPVEALRHMSLLHAAMSFAGSAVVLLLAITVFYQGLKRYESGNLVAMQG